MNTFTTTNKHALWVEDAQNNPVQVPFMLSQRHGATHDLISATMGNFAFACAVMAAGMEWDSESDKFANHPAAIDAMPDEFGQGEDLPHNEACVQIFTDQFPFWHNDKINQYSLNIFNEYTHPFHVVEGFYITLNAGVTVAEICNRLKPANAPQTAPSAPTRHAAPAQGQSELDKHFGPKQNAPAPASTGLPDGVEPGETGQPPIIRNWDYKLEDTYNQFFSGKRVDVEIGKVERVVVAKNDGSGSFEVVRMWPFYNGEFPKYAPFPLSFFVDTEPRDYSDWKTFAKDWGPYFPAPGSSHIGNGVARFKVNPSKNGDKVYWNFQSLRFDEPFEPGEVDELPLSAEERALDVPF